MNADVCYFLDKNRLRIIDSDPEESEKGEISMGWHTPLNTDQRSKELS